jgi:ABC-2 type transport system permease protein
MKPLENSSLLAPDRRIRAVLAPSAPADSAGPISTVLTFAWRGLLKIKHMPTLLADVILTPIWLTLLFTYLFGGAIANSPQEYLQFLLPGMLVQVVIIISCYTALMLNADFSRGVFDRFNSMPVQRLAPLAGAILGEAARNLLGCLLVIAIGLAIGYRPATGAVGIALTLILVLVAAFGFGWIPVIFGLLASSERVAMTLVGMIASPAIFVSNIFVDPATMPPWLQDLVAVNPVTHLTTAARGILSGDVSAIQIVFALFGPALIAAILAPIALALYQRER